MSEEIEQEIPEVRIAFSQARKSFRKANPKRQVEPDAVSRFQTNASKLVDLFAKFTDMTMIKPPNSGKDCRIKVLHVDVSYLMFENQLLKVMQDTIKEEKE